MKQQLDRFNDREFGRRVTSDVDALRTTRRAGPPLPLIDRRQRANTNVFPPFRSRPIPSFAQSRSVSSSPEGAAAASPRAAWHARSKRRESNSSRDLRLLRLGAVGIDDGCGPHLTGDGRPLAELAAGGLPRHPVAEASALRADRFARLSVRKGVRAIERLFDSKLWNMSAGETAIPIYAPVYNFDAGRLETFGSRLTPELTIGELVRISVALPLVMEAGQGRRLGLCGRRCGGRVRPSPDRPRTPRPRDRRQHDPPSTVRGRGHLGLEERPLGFMTASRQLSHAGHLELARRAKEEAGPQADPDRPDCLLELHGWRFYDLFIDRRKWPRLIMQGYEHTKRVLERHARAGQRGRVALAKPVETPA